MLFNKLKSISIFVLFFCASHTNGFAQTSTFETIESNGLLRDYKLYLPATYDGTTPVPLVFNLHGYGSNFIEQEQYGEFRNIADTANFILIHPNGTPDNSNTMSWNTFGNSSTNDLLFFNDLIDTLSAHFNIDTNAIFSTGMSNGGFMSYALACAQSDKFAAIASVTGSITTPNFGACVPAHPISVMEIHGTADGTVPYAGNILFTPVENVVNFWVQHNACTSTPVFTAVPDIVTTDNCTAEHYVYENGTDGAEVEFYKIIGGGHSWPGAPVNLNVTNMDFNASVEIWRFFRSHKRNNTITAIKKNETENLFSIAPNPFGESFSLNFNDAKTRTITIYNQLGEVVSKTNCSSNSITIETEKPGLYFVDVYDGTSNHFSKVVKQ